MGSVVRRNGLFLEGLPYMRHNTRPIHHPSYLGQATIDIEDVKIEHVFIETPLEGWPEVRSSILASSMLYAHAGVGLKDIRGRFLCRNC